jgi:hypothetical protein
MAQNTIRNIFIGALSGVVGGALCLIIIYLSSVVVIAFKLRDLFATLLAALTVLPLLLLLIVLMPTILMGVTIGLLAATAFSSCKPALSYIVTAGLGFVLAELIFAVVLPWIAPPENGDFVSMASNPYQLAVFGLILGMLTNTVYRKLTRS